MSALPCLDLATELASTALPSTAWLAADAHAWWDERTAGLIGGWLGSGAGILGGVFGTLVGVCATRGKARSAVLGTQLSAIGLGLLLLLAGLVAALLGQPFHVWFPLGLPGLITALVMAPMYPLVKARYAEAEQRKLAAAELRRG